MNWFKHKSNALSDPFIHELIQKFGSDGYLVWFGCLEIMASEDSLDAPALLSRSFLTAKLCISEDKLIQVLAFCRKKNKLEVVLKRDEISIYCLKLKELRDDYARKRDLKNSKKCPDTVRTVTGQCPRNTETEEEVDTEKEGEGEKNAPAPFSLFLESMKAEFKNSKVGKASPGDLFIHDWQVKDLEKLFDSQSDKSIPLRAWKAYINRFAEQWEEIPTVKSFVKKFENIILQ